MSDLPKKSPSGSLSASQIGINARDDATNNARAAWQASIDNTDNQVMSQDAPGVVSALNSGNYQQAWQDALNSESAYSSPADNSWTQATGTANSATSDPLVSDLESSQGLQSLDPTLQMTPQQIQQYYSAFGNVTGAGTNTFNANPLGKNAYGLWGNAADNSSGFTNAANANAQAGGLANVGQYLGATPGSSFDDKWLPGIIEAVGTAVSGGAASAIGGLAGAALGAGTTAATEAATGQKLNAGSIAAGALGAGATSALGGALNGATGIGATASDALAGAGVGATKSALTGGNVLAGAVGGAAGGALQGSGIAQTATNALTNEGLPSPLASAITSGVIGAGTGALGAGITGGNAATGAEVGGVSGAVTGGINGATGGANGLGTAGGIIAGGLLSKYLGSGSGNTSAAPAPAATTAPAATAPTPTIGKVNAPTAPSSAAAPQSGATVVSPQPTPTTGTAPANIGSYAGLGYQPMQQSNYAQNTNWNNYGQGPEQSFFQPVPGT
jgi:hypothetical protein